MDAAVTALEKAGHPVVRIVLGSKSDLGQEFFRWEIATATAGSVIGINTFNQPDVEASKIETRKLTGEYEATGKLPSEAPFFEDQGLKLFADEKNAAALKNNPHRSEVLRPPLSRIGSGDYFGLLGYIQMNDAHEKSLQAIRHQVRDAKKSATCLGFGPRFLHSTGQAYKGGPNTGVFLQLTCDDAPDIPLPGQKFTFPIVQSSQATRHQVGDAKKSAPCLGFGPRFLHSTGQAYKGGPNTGVFLQLTCDDAADIPVPGQKFTFGIVKAAQARGDFAVLSDRDRRALRIHLGKNVKGDLAKLAKAVKQALA